jgi:hypothetical protein
MEMCVGLMSGHWTVVESGDGGGGRYGSTFTMQAPTKSNEFQGPLPCLSLPGTTRHMANHMFHCG